MVIFFLVWFIYQPFIHCELANHTPVKSINNSIAKNKAICLVQNDVIFDEAVATTSVTVTREYSKRETVTKRVEETHQNTSTHRSDGTAHFIISQCMVQEGAKNVNASFESPQPGVKPDVTQHDVHDTRRVTIDVQRHGSSGFWGGLFGGSVRKSYHFRSAASMSRGSENAGKFFKMVGERFTATNSRFTADRSDIEVKHAEFKAGVNHHQSLEQSSSSGPIWNRVSVTSERHDTHVNPHFARPVYLHKPDGDMATTVIVERVRGSGAFPNLHSETPIEYRDMDDTHEHHHHSQKSLTAGAALITKLAVGLILYSNPVTFGLSGTPGIMVNAGFGALCGDTAVCLIENDGDIGRTMSALGKRDIVKNVARSMLAAGLVRGITDAVSTPAVEATTGAATTTTTTAQIASKTAEEAVKTFGDYAQTAIIQSAVNTALSVAMDGQDFAEALKQGVAMAGINTVASWTAGKIGKAYFGKSFDAGTHKALHGLLGAASGATTAAVFDKDVGKSAVAGALGAVVATTITEMLMPDTKEALAEAASKRMSPKEFKEEFIEKAQRSAQWGNFTAAVAAFALEQDVVTAHAAASSATANNCVPSIIAGIGEAVAILEAVAEGGLIAQRYWRVIEATFAAGGTKALLDLIKVTQSADGSYIFQGQRYDTLISALGAVQQQTTQLSVALVVSYISKMSGIDQVPSVGTSSTPLPDAAKPKILATPIQESGPTTLSTPLPDTEKVWIEGFEIPKALEAIVRQGLRESFDAYDGPRILTLEQRIHILYGKKGPDGAPDYGGRTSGEADSVYDAAAIERILRVRDSNHHMNPKGFGPAQQIEVSSNPDVIRGLEQIYIDQQGGAQSMGGTSSNSINSISQTNPKREQYLDAAKKYTTESGE